MIPSTRHDRKTRAIAEVLVMMAEVYEPTVKALHDIDIHPVNGIERPCFVLAILKLAFLMGRKGLVKSPSDRCSQFLGCVQRKQAQTRTFW